MYKIKTLDRMLLAYKIRQNPMTYNMDQIGGYFVEGNKEQRSKCVPTYSWKLKTLDRY